MGRIDTINGQDRKAPAATKQHPETVIDDEDI
jgi:hypothetical protein